MQRHIDFDHDELQIPAGTRRLDYSGSAPRSSRDGRSVAIARQTARRRGHRRSRRSRGRSSGARPRTLSSSPGTRTARSGTRGKSARNPVSIAVSRGGRTRPVLRASGWVLHDIAPDGRLLLERAIARQSLRVRLAGDAKERELSWLDGSTLAGVSTERQTAGLLRNQRGRHAGRRGLRAGPRRISGRSARGRDRRGVLPRTADGRWCEASGRRHATRSCRPAPGSRSPSTSAARASWPRRSCRAPSRACSRRSARARTAARWRSSRRRASASSAFPRGSRISRSRSLPRAIAFAYRTGAREIALCQFEKPGCRKQPACERRGARSSGAPTADFSISAPSDSA